MKLKKGAAFIAMISAVCICTNVLAAQTAGTSAKNSAGTSAKNIKTGDYVVMGNYLGEDILWRCVGFEKIAGYTTDGKPILKGEDNFNKATGKVDYSDLAERFEFENKDGYIPIMMSDEILSFREFDAEGYNVTGSHTNSAEKAEWGEAWKDDNGEWVGKKVDLDILDRNRNGSPFWGDSTLRCWLNSNAGSGKVNYTCGNPPLDKTGFESGFLTNFTAKELNAISDVSHSVRVFKFDVSDAKENVHGYNETEYYYFTDKMTVRNYFYATPKSLDDPYKLNDFKSHPNVSEGAKKYGTTSYSGEPEGQATPCWTDGVWYDQTWAIASFAGIDNSPQYSSTYVQNTRWMFEDFALPYSQTYGVRPTCFLNTSASFVSGIGTKASPYRIENANVSRQNAFTAEPKLIVDGNETQFVSKPFLYTKEGSSDMTYMLPLRETLAAVGVAITYDKASNRYKVETPNGSLVFNVAENVMAFTNNQANFKENAYTNELSSVANAALAGAPGVGSDEYKNVNGVTYVSFDVITALVDDNAIRSDLAICDCNIDIAKNAVVITKK